MKNTKTRIIFFTIALTYNLILGFYLRDFLVLSPTLQIFYLLSVSPTLFLTVKANSKVMKTIVFISLILIAYMVIFFMPEYENAFSGKMVTPLPIVASSRSVQ